MPAGMVKYLYNVLFLYVLETLVFIGHVFRILMEMSLLSQQWSNRFLKNDLSLGVDGYVSEGSLFPLHYPANRTP
jgi:hypothetical protein